MQCPHCHVEIPGNPLTCPHCRQKIRSLQPNSAAAPSTIPPQQMQQPPRAAMPPQMPPQAYQPPPQQFYPSQPGGMPMPNPQSNSSPAMILGWISLIGWLLPIVGLPVSIIGLILAKKSYHTKALRLNLAGLILSLINAIIGAIMMS